MEGLRLVGERTMGPGTVKRLEEKRRLLRPAKLV